MLCSWPAHEEMHKKSSLYYESNTIHCENLLCKKPLVPPWLWFEASILCFCQSVIKILCQKETHLDAESQDWIHLKQMNILQCCPTINVRCKALTNQNLSPASIFTGLWSSRAQWPPAPNFCPQATRKSLVFSFKSYAGHPKFYRFKVLGSLQFSLEHSLAFKYFLMETLRERWGNGSKGALLRLQAHNTATGHGLGQCLLLFLISEHNSHLGGEKG